jgi:hypothetical protein
MAQMCQLSIKHTRAQMCQLSIYHTRAQYSTDVLIVN